MAPGVITQDHTWDLNGLLVGNSGAVWKHVSSAGFDIPPFRVSDELKPQGHGIYFLGPDYMEGRTIEMTIAVDSVYGVNYQQLMDNLKAIMSPRSDTFPLRWKYNNVEIRRLNVRPRKCQFDIDELTTHGLLIAHLQFMAGDPLIYSDTENSSIAGTSVTTGGLGFPHAFPHGFGSTAGTSVILTNAGTYPTAIYGRVMATGGGIGRWRLTNVTTGEFFSMTITLSGGQWIDFDFSAKTVLLNGTSSRSINVDRPGSTWWDLNPGPNEVQFTADAISGGSATATMYWRNAIV